jgi:hypothetical protein
MIFYIYILSCDNKREKVADFKSRRVPPRGMMFYRQQIQQSACLRAPPKPPRKNLTSPLDALLAFA